MSGVKIKNLNKNFGTVIAVKNLTLEINDGEFLVLLGPSGCGKTTCLRCIAGLETPTSGQIYIGETLVNDLPPRERDVSMVFQSYALFPHMTVFNNIAFPLKMRKFPKLEIENQVNYTAELLQISKLLDRKPKELSGGQMQRVALGRALIREPKVFLMDEPLSNLDAKLRIYMRAELKDLQKRLAITTIYVTHDQVEALTMADRIAILNEGVLQQLGNADEIYNTPKNVFVAGFIGNPPMNLIECSLLKKSGKVFLKTAFFMIDITLFKNAFNKVQEISPKLIIGFRPEDAHLTKERMSNDSFEANIFVIEPLGAQLLITLRVGDDLLKVLENPNFKANVGEKVWLSLDKKKIHIFDKETQARVYLSKDNS